MENTTYGWIFAIIIFFIVAGFMNGGFFGNGNNYAQGALTRGELCQDMNFQELSNAVRGVQSGLCDGFYAQNTTMLNGLSGLQRDLCTGFSGVNATVNSLGSQMQNCCCETNRNIDAVRYEDAQNTCSIITNTNNGVQRILDKMCETETQNLRDQLSAVTNQLSQAVQSNNIISALQPKTPIPAYLTCSPYMSSYVAYNGLSNGCGCGSTLI